MFMISLSIWFIMNRASFSISSMSVAFHPDTRWNAICITHTTIPLAHMSNACLTRETSNRMWIHTIDCQQTFVPLPKQSVAVHKQPIHNLFLLPIHLSTFIAVFIEVYNCPNVVDLSVNSFHSAKTQSSVCSSSIGCTAILVCGLVLVWQNKETKKKKR